MTFDDYQVNAMKTAQYPELKEKGLLYPALKLAGEAGEVAEKVGKIWRNEGKKLAGELSEDQRIALAKEVGDVLWYCAAIADSLGISLDEIAQGNNKKLADRQARGVIKSEGDTR